MAKPTGSAYDGTIYHRERDVQLALMEDEWPEGCPLGQEEEEARPGAGRWQRGEGYLYRTISPMQENLWEYMLRFPNAPVYGLHNRPGRLPHVDGRSNFHTMRVIAKQSDPKQSGPPTQRIKHVYVLHNGLNETGDAELHYELASRLLLENEDSVCILRPFPGHLTRYPYTDRFAENPLDTYLLDSGNLFRQFTRFMLETRWLLSILVPRAKYNVITGGTLVDCDQYVKSEKLAKKIVEEWEAMDAASVRDPSRPKLESADVTVPAVRKSIDVLREVVLKWHPMSEDEIPNSTFEEPPAVHMVGYSLGGFLAQSAFLAWPYAIGGCVTLFGGGELRKLAPTAFAQPEEWQSVLHSLRYELDRAMKEPLIPEANGRIRGIEQETFGYLQRVFYEVFLQYYQGSYRTRLAEFVQRMLFVTGGQDPIVRPDNVLEAAPPEGVNQITIAGMSHFPMRPKAQVQAQQRVFWLEQLGRIIPSFAEQADERRREVLQRSWLNDEGTTLHAQALQAYKDYKDKLDDIGEPPSEGRLTSTTPLADRWFGKEIERICDFIGEGSEGWVLVSRNEIPPVFQTEDVLRRYAAGLHHSEDLAADEFWLASKRRDSLLSGRSRVTLLVSDNALEIGFQEDPSIFPPRSETPGVPRLTAEQRNAAQDYFEVNWHKKRPSAVRVLSPREFRPAQLGEIGVVVGEEQRDPGERETKINMRFLPDAWIGMDAELLQRIEKRYGGENPEGSRARAEQAIVGWATGLAQERKGAWNLLEKARQEEWVSIVEFSRAGLNPRYRGQRLVSSKRIAGTLVHWALAYKATFVRDRRGSPPKRRRRKRSSRSSRAAS